MFRLLAFPKFGSTQSPNPKTLHLPHQSIKFFVQHYWFLSVYGLSLFCKSKPGHFDFAADPSSQQFRVLLSLWECCIIISDGCRRRTSTWGRIAAPCDGTHSGPPSRPQSQPGYWHALFILPKDARTRIQNKGLWMKLWYSKTMCLFSSAVLLNHLLGLWHHVCFSRITHVLAALLFEKMQFQYLGLMSILGFHPPAINTWWFQYQRL